MSLLSARGLAMVYGADEIFAGIALDVPPDARIALVGPNGAGKTTLLRIFVGDEIPTAGDLRVARGIRVGWLAQEAPTATGHTLFGEARAAFRELEMMQEQLAGLEKDMADPGRHAFALRKYGPLQERFERAGGYQYETRARMVLQGLGFVESEYETPLTQLSGGQQTRARLARLLLEEPQLLVLDEPTNHLDIEARTWLERWLQDYPHAVLAASHDRWFVDSFARQVLELDYGTLTPYRGNYSQYLRQRRERRARRRIEYEAQQEYIAKEEAYIRKNMGGRLTAQAKGRQKRLDTMRRRGRVIARPRGERRSMGLRMDGVARSGDRVLVTRGLTVGYEPAAPLLRVPDLTLQRGEVAALVGPNGVGKSALLKTLVGQLPPLAGNARLGAAVQIGYFAQAHEQLRGERRVIDEILAARPMGLGAARDLLGRYLFSGDEVYRPLDALSGGERGRLALATLALGGANFLLLDEPGNHLDIGSQEALQAVLEDFAGTVLLVSHDRWLVAALATQIWAARPGELQVFRGNWAAYRAAGESAARESAPAKEQARSPQAGPNRMGDDESPAARQRRVRQLEARITGLELRLAELEAELAAAGNAAQAERIGALGSAWVDAGAELDAALEEWAALAG